MFSLILTSLNHIRLAPNVLTSEITRISVSALQLKNIFFTLYSRIVFYNSTGSKRTAENSKFVILDDGQQYTKTQCVFDQIKSINVRINQLKSKAETPQKKYSAGSSEKLDSKNTSNCFF